MALDAYAACPCGSGKKIKFCAPKNSNAEMSKIVRAIEGDQRASALDQVKRLLEGNPDSDCLMRMKADLEMTLGFDDAWRASVEELAGKAPNDPGSHLRRALILASEVKPAEAAAAFQEAMEQKDEKEPLPIVALTALDTMIEAFIGDGNAATAACLMWLQAGLLSQLVEENADRQLRAFLGNPRIPLAVKHAWSIDPPPSDVAWHDEYTAAMKHFQALRFRKALETMKRVAKQHAEPLVLRGVAYLEQMLGLEGDALKSWDAYIGSGGVSDEDVINALALRYWLDESRDTISQQRVTYEVTDIDKLRACFIDHGQLKKVNIPPSPEDEDTPPPQLAGHWLDSPLADDSDKESRIIAATVLYYGRETDREARLEIMCWQDDLSKQQLPKIREHFAGTLSEEAEEETLSSTTLLGHLLGRQYFVGKLESIAEQQQFQSDAVGMGIAAWLDAPADCLNGKTPREAAGDSDLKLPLAAYFFNLRAIGDCEGWLEQLNPVRDELDLPLLAFEIGSLVGPSDIHSLVNRSFELLEDEDLPQIISRASTFGLRGTMERGLKEILKRPSLKGKVDRSGLYLELARTANVETALEYFEKAKLAADEEGNSRAPALIAELTTRLMAGQGEEAKAILQTLQENHINEPGVAEHLQSLLTMGGRVDPQQMSEEAEATSSAEPSGLWTPESQGSGNAGGDSGEQKSKLWVPGMD